MEQPTNSHGNVANSAESQLSPDEQREMMNRNAEIEAEIAEKCSICLCSPKVDEARLDGCLHTFCFPCIVEWLKLRAICPMCKTNVTKVSHRVKKEESDEMMTEDMPFSSIQNLALRQRIEIDSIRPMMVERSELVRRIRHLQRLVRIHDDIFNYGQNENGMENDGRRCEYVDRINRYQLLLDNWERPRREVVADPSFRALVYDLRLRRVPLVRTGGIVTGRLTGISPQYFQENERTERPRISAFVRRELSVVIPHTPDLERIVAVVYNLAMHYQIMTPQFTSCLCRESYALVNVVDHFVELLYEFAASGQDLGLFDQNSEYIRTEYRRRLESTQLAAGGNGDDDVIEVDSGENFVANNSRHPAADNRNQENRNSRQRLHVMSAYADTLVSLRRFLLVLESADEVLTPNDEAVLGEAVEQIVQSYVQYRDRSRYQRERASSQRGLQHDNNRRREIVLSDSNSDNENEQGLSNAADGGESAHADSQNAGYNRRRSGRLSQRHRNQRLYPWRNRHQMFRAVIDSLNYYTGYYANFQNSTDAERREMAEMIRMYGLPPHRPDWRRGGGPLARAAGAEAAAAAGPSSSSGRPELIDLDNSSSHDDSDVMVVREFPDQPAEWLDQPAEWPNQLMGSNLNNNGNDENDIIIDDDLGNNDIVIDDDDDDESHEDVLIEEDYHRAENVVMDDDTVDEEI